MQYFHIISKDLFIEQVLDYFRAEFKKSGFGMGEPNDKHCKLIVNVNDKKYGFNPKDNDIVRTFYVWDSKQDNEWNFRNFINDNNICIQKIFNLNLKKCDIIKDILENFSTCDYISDYQIKLYHGIYHVIIDHRIAQRIQPFLDFLDSIESSPSPLLDYAKECLRCEVPNFTLSSIYHSDSDAFIAIRDSVRSRQNAFKQLHTILAGGKVDPLLLLPCVTEQLAQMGIN